MQRVRGNVNKLAAQAHNFYRVTQVLEPDVLLSCSAAVILLLMKTLAPMTVFWSNALSLVSYWFLFLSVTASWAVARRFVRAQTDEDWELSKEKSLIFVLGPSVLGMPALCSVILPFTFPAYTRQWAMYHFIAALLPSLWIAITGKRSSALPTTSSTQDSASTSPPKAAGPGPSFFRIPSLPRLPSRRSKAAMPLRVAVLRGLRIPRPSGAPRMHPLVRKYMFRPTSDLKFEVAEDPIRSIETIA